MSVSVNSNIPTNVQDPIQFPEFEEVDTGVEVSDDISELI